jgi:Zn-dependent protease with chaperone function
MATADSNTSVLGPRDRESFFDAQRRNRRATWRLSAVSVLAAVVMGIPLALIVTPLIYAVTLIGAYAVNYFLPLPAGFWQQADKFASFAMIAGNWLFEHKPADPQSLALGAAVMLLPGAVLSIGLWLGVNALFRHAGVGGALLALKAREPNPADLKELRLSDVVQEMAIAAGVPAPRVVLIDAPAANAAVIGTSQEDARIVVSRGLLDQLSRDELQGALAHLVASIGNGDLRIAFRVTSVFETCGLLVALINSPFGPQSRRTLWRILRYGLGGKGGAVGAEEAAAVAAILTRGAGLETDDIDRLFDTTSSRKSVLRSIRNFLLFPIFFTNTAIKLSLWFFSFSMLEPSVALLWRTRIYLADAAAVQLTRNPDGLAEALRKLNDEPRAIPGGEWASHLFLVNPGGSDRMNDEKPNAAQQQMLARVWAETGGGNDSHAAPPAPADLPSTVKEIAATGRAAMAGDQKAMARMEAFRQAAASALGTPPEEMPDWADIAAAQHGDAVALQHLQEFSRKTAATRETQNESEESSDVSRTGFTGFHPSLKRRLKRLDRMGAHVQLESDGRRPWIAIVVLSLLLGPPLLAAAALLVLLIGIMTMASLTFLVVWLAFIHAAVGLLVGH